MLRYVFKWTTLKIQSSGFRATCVFFQLQLVEELNKNYMKYLSITCLVKQELEIQTCSFSTWLFQGVCRQGISSSVFHVFAVKSGKLYFNPALTLVPVLVRMKMKWNLGAVVLVLGTNKFWSDQWLLFRGSVFYRVLIFMVKVNYSLKWPFTSQLIFHLCNVN